MIRAEDLSRPRRPARTAEARHRYRYRATRPTLGTMEPVSQTPPTAAPAAEPGSEQPRPGGDRADCVLCGEPTEHPATTEGATLCPVCEWQQAEREAACSC